MTEADNIARAKAQIRARSLARRDQLDEHFRKLAAEKLIQWVTQIEPDPARIISAYWPIRSEFDLRPLMTAFSERGNPLCLPVVIDKTTIVFREYQPDSPLIKAGFGTMGPGSDAPVCDPQTLLMPLSAFDNNGNRIGYGAGHYDRAISRLHAKGVDVRLVGFGFECQKFDNIPTDHHDMPLDLVVTEAGILVVNSQLNRE